MYRLINRKTGAYIDFKTFGELQFFWKNRLSYKMAMQCSWRFV